MHFIQHKILHSTKTTQLQKKKKKKKEQPKNPIKVLKNGTRKCHYVFRLVSYSMNITSPNRSEEWYFNFQYQMTAILSVNLQNIYHFKGKGDYGALFIILS